jgi:uncharacterized membrane protein YkvA (DUF1232 family)
MAAPPERPAAGKKAAPVKKASATKKAASKKPAAVKKPSPKATVVDRDAEKKAASAAESPFFARAQKRARKLLSSPDDLGHLVDRANRQSRWATAGPLAELATDLKALLRLIAAYARGDYRDVSLPSMILVVGAILYVLTPIDVIPDFIPGIGLLDDAAVVTFVLRRVRDEIEAFLEWEQARL